MRAKNEKLTRNGFGQTRSAIAGNFRVVFSTALAMVRIEFFMLLLVGSRTRTRTTTALVVGGVEMDVRRTHNACTDCEYTQNIENVAYSGGECEHRFGHLTCVVCVCVSVCDQREGILPEVAVGVK